MSLISIAPGDIGTVVTYLEMTDPPRPAPMPDSPLRMIEWKAPAPDKYRALFARVGGRWLWYSRLAMDDETLSAAIGEVYAIVDPRGVEVGMVELDRSNAGQCVIRFLGLVPELAGRGHGGWLFAETLARAWRQGVGRVAVSTCSLDHPAALPAYLRAGFHAYARAFETFPDPRLADLLPRDAAPQMPIVPSPESWR